MTEETTTTLWQKIHSAMSELRNVPKRGYNDFHSYAYVTAEDVLSAAQSAFLNNDLIFLPSMTGVRQEGTATLVDFTFEIRDTLTGESVVLPWVGEANDKQDKGTSKAATSAVKYFLLKLFLVGTGDPTDDPDHMSIERARASGTPPVRTGQSIARNDGDGGGVVMPMGKFKGKTISQIYADRDNDGPDYLTWIISDAFEPKQADGRKAKMAASVYLSKQQAPVEEETPTGIPENWDTFFKRAVSELKYEHVKHALTVRDKYLESVGVSLKDDPPVPWTELWNHMHAHQAEKERI